MLKLKLQWSRQSFDPNVICMQCPSVPSYVEQQRTPIDNKILHATIGQTSSECVQNEWMNEWMNELILFS
jgi:hypothetical protein